MAGSSQYENMRRKKNTVVRTTIGPHAAIGAEFKNRFSRYSARPLPGRASAGATLAPATSEPADARSNQATTLLRGEVRESARRVEDGRGAPDGIAGLRVRVEAGEGGRDDNKRENGATPVLRCQSFERGRRRRCERPPRARGAGAGARLRRLRRNQASIRWLRALGSFEVVGELAAGAGGRRGQKDNTQQCQRHADDAHQMSHRSPHQRIPCRLRRER